MRTATTVVQMLTRLVGLTLLVLGVLLWTRILPNVISLHMMLGYVFVLLLWTMAGLAARAGVHWGLVVLAIVWGFVIPALGITQSRLLPGAFHWVIQIVHLLVGFGAMGFSESLARRIKERWNPVLNNGLVGNTHSADKVTR